MHWRTHSLSVCLSSSLTGVSSTTHPFPPSLFCHLVLVIQVGMFASERRESAHCVNMVWYRHRFNINFHSFHSSHYNEHVLRFKVKRVSTGGVCCTSGSVLRSQTVSSLTEILRAERLQVRDVYIAPPVHQTFGLSMFLL